MGDLNFYFDFGFSNSTINSGESLLVTFMIAFGPVAAVEIIRLMRVRIDLKKKEEDLHLELGLLNSELTQVLENYQWIRNHIGKEYGNIPIQDEYNFSFTVWNQLGFNEKRKIKFSNYNDLQRLSERLMHIESNSPKIVWNNYFQEARVKRGPISNPKEIDSKYQSQADFWITYCIITLEILEKSKNS